MLGNNNLDANGANGGFSGAVPLRSKQTRETAFGRSFCLWTAAFPTFTSVLFSPSLYTDDSRASFGELIMPPDSLSEDIAGLLCMLEEFERSIGKRPISTHWQPAKLHDEAESKMAYLTNAVDRSENRFVERIAAAMSKLRIQAV
jgi:hypothetical protein